MRSFCFAVLSAGFVAACSGPQTISGDPEAVVALRAQPSAQYAATVALAQRVANGCAVYRYRVDLGQAIDAQRAVTGSNLAIARTQVTAVDLETDVATRTLLARYEVAALEGPDVCAIAAGEVARRSALGALLQRV